MPSTTIVRKPVTLPHPWAATPLTVAGPTCDEAAALPATARLVLRRADVLAGVGPGGFTSAGHRFRVEAEYLALRAEHTAVEVPVHFEERAAGTSKTTLSVQRESAVLPWNRRFGTPKGGRTHA
jgi:hypothetical protein